MKQYADGDIVIERKMQQFMDASRSIVPVCIMGNYSTGKSTFINSLIGLEILPNGDEPVTAKIFKITSSDRTDYFSVSFTANGYPVSFILDRGTGVFKPDGVSLPIVTAMTRVLVKNSDKSDAEKIYMLLCTINNYDFDNDTKEIGDLIELTVPFMGGVLGETKNKYIIFDTPGSNSSTNRDHFEILKDAMEGFSDGLPIFLANYSSLDSTDNENLFNEICKIEAMDRRFAMIVINKADVAQLPSDGHTLRFEKRVLIIIFLSI